MSDDARHEHHMLLEQTGRKRLSDEQKEIIRKLDGDTLTFEDEDDGKATLDLRR